MVHNGIEYGLMQLIAETYDLLTRGFEMTAGAIAELFAEWDRGELNSFLIEISATVLKKRDTKTGSPLVDVILDTAGQKGTGKWTSQVAMDLGIPVPTIDSAVTMRQISAHKTERIAASEKLRIAVPLTIDEQLRESALESVRDGLYLAFILTYAQGMSLLKAASVEKGYELDMVEIARIWRGGCIIRAALLEKIREAFSGEPTLENLILADTFIPVIRRNHAQLKAAFVYAMSCDVPCLALSASYNYMRSLASERLPANLIQAQRDYFGAHTYQRLDETGTFHTPDWDEA
jgi:6-phosphogluconate dehydrogenase